MAYIVCTSNLDLVSFLFVPALYSTLKLEIFPFTCSIIIGLNGTIWYTPWFCNLSLQHAMDINFEPK